MTSIDLDVTPGVRRSLLGGLTVALVALLVPAGALASAQEPQWTVSSISRPTNLAPGDSSGKDSYQVLVTNTGGVASDGSPITITDELPTGLSLDVVGPTGEDALAVARGQNARENFHCVLATCTYTGVVVPDQTLVVAFPVDVAEDAPASVTNVVRVSGGGALDAVRETPTTISAEHAGFGISPGGSTTSLSGVQAGAHPDLTTSIAFNTIDAQGTLAGNPKNTIDDLPPGFAGADLADTPTCTDAQFVEERCPVDSQVGITTLTLHFPPEPNHQFIPVYMDPVYNLTPSAGQAAKFGFVVAKIIPVEGAIYLRGDYGVRAVFENISQSLAELGNVSLTIWGVPSAPDHYPIREEAPPNAPRGALEEIPQIPFFTSPTSCGTESLRAQFTVDSWQEPESDAVASMPFGPIVGCDHLAMEPSLTAEPTTTSAESPTGLDVTIKIPQSYNNPEGLATSHLKKAVVTLPEGMTLNPSAGSGLEGCTPAQFEEEAVESAVGGGCPNTSKLGTVRAHTPVLKEEAFGSVFLASPYANPFKSLLAIYIVARIPNRGIIVKAAGEIKADPVTGRIVTTFDDLPQVPYDSFTLAFRQGETSPLVSPPACGQYLVAAQMTPWANPEEVLDAPVLPFSISTGVGGGPCPTGGVPPLAPQATAGTQNNDAGSYSPFYLRLTRNDGEQEITKFSTTLAHGLTGNLTGIPFCSEAQIEAARSVTGAQELAEPSCPAASEIGHTVVGAGVGSVLAQTPGKVYLAGPYHGSALSIVSITAAKVGPFDLGTVVIRFALRINPVTAQVEVDSNGSDPIPHIIDGIVVHVRDIRVYVDRPNFILNPTSCEPMSIAATVTGTGADVASEADDQSITVTNRFQASNCAKLAFKPIFKASTVAKTSRKNGASLHVTLGYPKAPQGSQANIRSVKVDLPRQLPSRLTTLQKACPDNVFEANPGGCPSASRIGTASAVTPILPVPLSGPVYFVSHAARSFPDLVIVLQGYGITIDLRGETFISKKGITSTTFRTVPDQPVTSFQLTLPQGPYSALAGNGNLCKVKGGLIMPTALVAQNGLTVHQSTKIGVSGCPKQKVAVHHKKSARAKKR
jgi:hypothetical protein